MCLSTGGSSKPALQERTLPAKGATPADESTKKNPVEPMADLVGQSIDKRAKTFDDIDKALPTTDTTTSLSDTGINY